MRVARSLRNVTIRRRRGRNEEEGSAENHLVPRQMLEGETHVANLLDKPIRESLGVSGGEHPHKARNSSSLQNEQGVPCKRSFFRKAI